MNSSFNTFRTIAFLSVFLFHANQQVFSFGYLGVVAFFVLSGYLITPILLKTKAQKNTLASYLKNFYGRRALRIFPLYYLYLMVLCIAVLTIGYKPSSYFAPIINDLPFTLTYTYNFYHLSSNFQHSQFISHLWSLAVEEQFYLLWPIAVYFLNHRWLKIALIATILAGPFLRLVSFCLFSQYPQYIISPADTAVYVSTFSHMDAFLTGGFAALYGKDKSIKSWQLYLALTALITTGLIGNILENGHPDFLSLGYAYFMPDSYKFIWGYTAWNAFFAILLIRLSKQNFHTRLFENHSLSFLGKISYGLYIYHYPILYMVKSYAPFQSSYLKMAIAFVLTVLLSWISFVLYENNFLALKNKLFPL